jgi:hypothetical protein
MASHGYVGRSIHSCRHPLAECLALLRCHGWVRVSRNMSSDLSEQHRSPDISSRILPWVIATIDSKFPSKLDRNPEQRCSCSCVCFEGCTRDFHGLPYDGFRTREGAVYTFFLPKSVTAGNRCYQWVDDIADAGGSLYCFHIEATCQSLVPHNDPRSRTLTVLQRIPSPLSTLSTRDT